eukprot:7044765-Prymnesium_polylepis.1
MADAAEHRTNATTDAARRPGNDRSGGHGVVARRRQGGSASSDRRPARQQVLNRHATSRDDDSLEVKRERRPVSTASRSPRAVSKRRGFSRQVWRRLVHVINWEWVGGGHVPCAERSQERAVLTAGKGER